MSVIVRRMLGSKREYTYTIKSNCVGGTVYFDGVVVGSIPSSRVFSITISGGKPSYNVTISGGVPDGYSSTSYELLVSTYNIVFPLSGGSRELRVTSYKSTTQYSFYAPSQAVVQRNGEVTMDYTSSSYESDVSNVQAGVYGGSSWLSFSGGPTTFTVSAGATSTARDGSFTVMQHETMDTRNINVSQR